MDKINIANILAKEISENQILVDEFMSKHTSFKIGGKADIFIKVKNVKELKYTIKIAKEKNVDLIIIGNGSNILVKDNGIRGIVVKLEFNNISIDGDVVTVGAGVKLGELARNIIKRRTYRF